ncbi:MAG TPA: CBS domain-containing protein [Humisphaera sp.]|nr:CBS domain-containing protein [Humisphaera sp.]
MPSAMEILSEKGTKVYTIGADATVLEATRKMNQYRIGALVVMDGDAVAGIFTERDVLQRVIGERMGPADVSVGEVMTKKVVCAPPETDIDELSEIMRSQRVRHVPICEEDGKLMGIVSIGDVNAMHANHQQATIHYLSEFIYGRM